MKQTLMWMPEGPKISYEWDFAGEYLHVEDLNPENSIRFRFTPTELLAFGLKCVWRSMIR